MSLISSLFGPAFGGIGNKDVNQTSSTTNVDASRVDTLTNSLNSTLNQNIALTRASNTTYNSAFDAIDSFNTVNSFELANIGGGPASVPTLDFTGLRSLFTNPADLSALINANKIDADPNANKYNFDFSSISAGGNEFLKSIQDLTRTTWEGLANANQQQLTNTPTTNLLKWVVIGAVVFGAIYLFLRFKR